MCSSSAGTRCRVCGHDTARARRQMSAVRGLILVALIAAALPADADLAEAPATAWAANNIRVSQSETGRAGSTNTHFEVAADGDARIAIERREDGTHISGTILLIGGRWMLTQ